MPFRLHLTRLQAAGSFLAVMPRHYLRIHKGRARGPESVLGYVAWDQRSWPIRIAAPCEWRTEPVTLEVVAKERWMMQPRRYKPLKRFP